MSPRTRYSFFLDDELAEGLKAVKERDGISESEQIRRGVKRWLEFKGLTPKQPTARKGGKQKR